MVLYNKEKAKAITNLEKTTSKLLKDTSFEKHRAEFSKFRVSDSVLLDRIQDYLPLGEPEQPGRRVVGAEHPCCVWYERLEYGGWYSTYGPVLIKSR